MSDAIHILLCSESPERNRSWSEALESLPCQIWLESNLPAGAAAADVVVTDRPLSVKDDSRLGQQAAMREVGVITIGIEAPGDVSLPPEATSRELRLACLLLGQIVRLRRDRREDLRAREVLSQQALSDPLTGLPNRRAYDLEITRRIRGLGSEYFNLCLALIDLDRFKEVNDRRGHAEGDRLLSLAGRALVDSVRGHDFVARLGGDEFAVLISNVAADAALRVIDRIRASVGPALEDQLSASVGLAVLAEPASAAALFQAADKALMQAKADGRNRAAESTVETQSSSPEAAE